LQQYSQLLLDEVRHSVLQPVPESPTVPLRELDLSGEAEVLVPGVL
jgi:hypothetical protein